MFCLILLWISTSSQAFKTDIPCYTFISFHQMSNLPDIFTVFFIVCHYIDWATCARIYQYIFPLPDSLPDCLQLSHVWLSLWPCFSTRVKKLRETLVAVQQLDKNMSSLRSWLAHIETELSRPIVYDMCDDQEIQRKLNQQQASGTTHRRSENLLEGYNIVKQIIFS